MTVRSILGMVAGVASLVTLSTGIAHADTLRWMGQVDDTAIIRLNNRDVRASGNFKGIRDVRSNIDGSLPNRPTRVRLTKESGRGDVEIIEQPSARNNYTAVVRVKDSQAGASRYGFVLQWDKGRDDRWDNRRDRRDDRRDDRWDNRWDNDRNSGRRP